MTAVPAKGDHAPPHRTGAPASARDLAFLCDRIALSLDAGLDLRRVLRSETPRHSGRSARALAAVRDEVERGSPLDEAFLAAGAFFPPLAIELVRVGEQTGSTAEVFRRLAQHYRARDESAREFRSLLAWPVLQLAAALAVVGGLIALGGVLTDGKGGPIDMLGWGLVGGGGLAVYVAVLGGMALTLAAAWRLVARLPRARPRLRALVSGLPVVGPVAVKFALARIAWTLRLTLNVALDLRRVAPLVLRSSGNDRFARHAAGVTAAIGRGEPLSTAFAATGVFPREFLEYLEVAEVTGTLVETLDRLCRRYDEEARAAAATLTRLAAFAVWVGVAAVVVGLALRVFSFYTGVLHDALEGV